MGELADAMGNIEKETVLLKVREAMEKNVNPLDIIKELRKGLDIVGEKFETGEIFLMNLVMAGEIFNDAYKILEPVILKRSEAAPEMGTIVIGTVYGDVHDLGKNIFVTLAKCEGFKVIDLGVEVPAETFVEKVKEYQPIAVGLSGLLTASIDEMQNTIDALDKAGLSDKVKVMVGGGIVGDLKEGLIPADLVTTQVSQGIKFIKSLAREK